MDVNKVAFIICSNDHQYLDECRKYIEVLIVPEGMTTEIIPVIGAKSMCAGYNTGMRSTDALYKVYLHQDTFILNQNLISDFIQAFNEDEKIGMLGVVGCTDLPMDALCFTEWNIGSILQCNGYSVKKHREFQNEEISYVWAVDGCLIITKTDLPWREDVFDGWDFYDISQGMEFTEAGHRVAVPYQKEPWCFHDCGILNLDTYDKSRNIFCDTYSKYFKYSETEEHKEKKRQDREDVAKAREVSAEIRKLYDSGKYMEAIYEVKKCREYKNKDNEFFSIFAVSSIILEEWKAGKDYFAKDRCDTDTLIKKYRELRFALFRMENGIESGNNLREALEKGNVSMEALTVLIEAFVYDKEKVYGLLT